LSRLTSEKYQAKGTAMFKRLIPVAGILGLLTIALAGSAAAGGGGGYGSPGLSKFTDWSASASLTDPTTGDFYGGLGVDRGMQSFKLKHTPGAPVVEKPGTVLYLQGPSGFGCWMIPDSAFVVARDLSSATLNVHATPDMQCPGFFVGSATGGKPGLQSSLGLDIGGPLQITDIVINLTWTGSGVQWSNRYSGNNKCLGYIATFQSTFDYEFSTATGTIGNATASDPLAQVGHSTQTNNANITVPAACNPYGF
jgi:hypothetical protein